MDTSSKNALVKFARETLESYFLGNALSEFPVGEHPALGKPAGAFVSLYVEGELRGCLGQIEADQPLYVQVRDLVVSAATRDIRFSGVNLTDLPDTEIEISVLSPMVALDDVQSIVVGEHGLFVESGEIRGLLLPQVAMRRGWTREQFLEETCLKAKLPREAFLNPDTRISTFTVELVKENEAEENE